MRPDMATQIENNFTYHPPKDSQAARHETIREAAKALAHTINALTLASREQSLALTNLEQAVFWANAAISRNE